MRVVTWNMGMNTLGSRVHEQAWRYLLELEPDLALLQESRPPAWAGHEGTLIHQPLKTWGSVILSRGYRLVPEGHGNVRSGL